MRKNYLGFPEEAKYWVLQKHQPMAEAPRQEDKHDGGTDGNLYKI